MKYGKIKVNFLVLAVFVLVLVGLIVIALNCKTIDNYGKAELAPVITPGPPREERTADDLRNVSVAVEERQEPKPESLVAFVECESISDDQKNELQSIDEPVEEEQEEKDCEIPIANPDEWGEPARYMAKVLYGEDPHGCTLHQAAVYWCILNRVDSTDWFAQQNDIITVCTAQNQFAGYNKDNPVDDEYYILALEVIGRWLAEKGGAEDVGRVLPEEYRWFTGDGFINTFRDSICGNEWDWSLPNPYGDKNG